MASIVDFKCPSCGAKLPFSGKTGEMTCEYCDASFSVEEIKAIAEEEAASAGSDMSWESSTPDVIKGEDGKISGYLCKNCGAEMVADENTAATECPYCGNFSIIPTAFEGAYKPDLVIPFAVDKQAAKDKLKDFVKGKKLLPSEFTQGNRIDKITGVYVPFWLYKCHASGSVTFEGVKSKRWEDSEYEYVKKDHYNIVRSGDMDFEGIPVDASKEMDDATMDSIEPFDLSKAVEYDPMYFSGYLSSRYDVEEKDCRPRADERVINTFRNKMRDEVNNYEEVSEKSKNIRLSNASAKYAMLPVWLMTTRYDNKTYSYGINGQTGKMVGSLPVDKGKYMMHLIIAIVLSLAVLFAGAYFLLGGISTGAVIGCVVAAIIIGFIYVSILKGGMNTIAVKKTAENYVNQNSVRVEHTRDRFMYSKTDKTKKQTQN